jgi:S-adenosylmethionine synthetase
MNHYAEYVSPGHPDRLADAIAETIVTAAVRQRTDALVGVEVAVHADGVFLDGRIAAGAQPVEIEKIVRRVYRAAGYGGSWKPDPEKIRITTDVCQEKLSAEESDIRPFSDDQNIVIGYACGDERTNYLPVAHWVSGELGRQLFSWIRGDPELSTIFGPDFKLLASLEVKTEEKRINWRHLVLSVQHTPNLPYERQHRILLPLLEQILGRLEAGGLKGVASTFTPDQLLLNGAGEFAIGGPEGDNGLSGKKLVIDHYGPGIPIGGGALAGKDPHKVDKCGALRARQWPRNSFARESMKPESLSAGRREAMSHFSSRHGPAKEA